MFATYDICSIDNINNIVNQNTQIYLDYWINDDVEDCSYIIKKKISKKISKVNKKIKPKYKKKIYSKKKFKKWIKKNKKYNTYKIKSKHKHIINKN